MQNMSSKNVGTEDVLAVLGQLDTQSRVIWKKGTLAEENVSIRSGYKSFS